LIEPDGIKYSNLIVRRELVEEESQKVMRDTEQCVSRSVGGADEVRRPIRRWLVDAVAAAALVRSIPSGMLNAPVVNGNCRSHGNACHL